MSAKSRQGQNPDTDTVKQEKKKQATLNKEARMQAMNEAEVILKFLGIRKDALSYTKQGMSPEPPVIAATSLVVLTLVQHIIQGAIDTDEKTINGERVEREWRQQHGILRVGSRSVKPGHMSVVSTLRAMIAGKSMTVETAQQPDIMTLLEEVIRIAFNPAFVHGQASDEKKKLARAIRSKVMRKFGLAERDLNTLQQWEQYKGQNSYFKEANYGSKKAPFDKEANAQIVCSAYSMTTRPEQQMDRVAEPDDEELDPQWFDEKALTEGLNKIISIMGSDIQVTQEGRRQLLEVVMHTLYNCFNLFGQMAKHAGRKRKIGIPDQEGGTKIIEKGSSERGFVPRPSVEVQLPDQLADFNKDMRATLMKFKVLICPEEGGPFSQFV